jgi:di/tricarboxylate transporter
MYFPDLPNPHAIAALALTVLAMVLFTREKIPLESTSLFVLVTLIVGFGLFPYEGPLGELRPSDFFHGFGHEALVAVCALMVAGQALVRTGALEPVARRLSRFWKTSPALALLATLLVGAALSAFMNNTPIVVLMLPMLIGAAIRSHSSTSGILLPMGLATIIGGMSTTIGTSTNLLVVSVAADMGMERLQMFDFIVPAVLAGSLALLYLWLVAPRLIPERQPPMIEESNRVFNAELLIPANNSLIGKRLTDVIRKAGGEINILRVGRGPGHFLAPLPDLRIEALDRLLVADTVGRLQDFRALLGAQLLAEESALEHLPPAGEQLVEVAVTLGSSLHGVRLGDSQLRERYGVDILALHSANGALPFEMPGIRQRKLEPSDVLLVQGDAWEIARLKTASELLVLDGKADLPLPELARRDQCAKHPGNIDYRGLAGAGIRADVHRRRGLDRQDVLGGHFRGPALAGAICADAADGSADQYRLEQLGGGDRHPDRDQHRDGVGHAAGTVRAGGAVRRQPEFRDADGLQDEPVGDERGRLQIQ